MSRRSGATADAGRRRIEAHATARELDDDLRAIAHVERAQDRADVHFHGSFGEPQIATDQLVRLALNEELQHIGLPQRESELLGPGYGLETYRAAGLRRIRGHIHSPRQDQPQSVEQYAGIGGLGNETHGAEIERVLDGGAIVRGGQNENRHPGPLAAQVCEQLEPVTTGQCEIEQDQIGIRFARQRCVRIGCVLRLHQLERRIEHGEHMLQCFLDQRMIVDDEDLHRSSPKAWDEDCAPVQAS